MGQGLATLTIALAGLGLTWLIQSSSLLGLGLLAGRIWKRSGPAVESAVYRTTLAAVLVCPVASTLLAAAGFDGLIIALPLSAAGEPPSPVSRVRVAQPWAARAETSVREQSRVMLTPPARRGEFSRVESPEVEVATPAPRPTWPRSPTLALAAVGLVVWLLGSTVLGLQLWVGQRRMRRLRVSSVPAEPDVEAICRDLAGRMGLRAPAVLRSPFLFSPCLDGIRRPAILLPDDVRDNLRETFVHELAHLARRDGFWNLLRRSAVVALWVQPLVWVLSRRLESAAEEVCDDHVVQFGADRACYARHLLELAGRARPQASPTSVGMVSLRSLLGRRIVRILDPSRALSTRAGTGAVLAMLVIGLAGTLLAGLLGIGEGKREARAQTEAKKAGAMKSGTNNKTIRGQVVGPEGQPVPGTIVTASAGPPDVDEIIRTAADRDGRFEPAFAMPERDLESDPKIVGLEPGKPRTVVFKHPGRKLGAVRNVPFDEARDDTELTVTLRPSATLTGRLVDARGQPFRGGVNITLPSRAPQVYSGVNGVFEVALEFGAIVIAEVKLDDDGRFRCDELPPGGGYLVRATNNLMYTPLAPMEREPFQMFVVARNLTAQPGQVIDVGTFDVTTAERVEAPAAKAEPADVPINGRIVDLEGRPVAGVAVNVESVQGPKEGDLTPWIDAVKKGEPPWTAYRHIDREVKVPENARRETTTDRDGRFRLEGLGGERVVELAIKGDTVAYTTMEVTTRNMAPVLARGFQNEHGPGIAAIHGADFTYTAAPSRPVEGVVKDAKTGQSLADAEIRSYRFAGSGFVGTMILKTRTDAQGRFRLAGLPKGKGNTLIVVPNDEQPYFMQEVSVPDPPGAAPVPVEVAMHRGVWIEGTVTEQLTGKSIRNARLYYLPYLRNTFAQALPEFHKDGNTDGVGLQDRYQTKADGTFRLVGLPGPAIVGAEVVDESYLQGTGSESIEGLNKSGHFETYNNPINPGKLWPTVMKEINPPAEGDVVHLDFQVTTGPSVRLMVVDPGDNPLTVAQTRGLRGRSSNEREEMTKAAAEVMNLMPGEKRIVMVRHESRKLGKVVQVRKGDDAKGPVVVTLEPLAALVGRVTDAGGNPVPGAAVRPDVLPHGDFGLSLPQVVTDENGTFHVPDVPTGCDYALAVESLEAIKEKMSITVKPGETTDVGEIRFKNE